MTELSSGQRFNFLIFFCVLLAHVAFLTLRIVHHHRLATVVHPKPKPIELKILKHPLSALRNKKQIVESEDPAAYTKSEAAKYLSDKNRTFDRQTRARTTGPFQKGGLGTTTAASTDENGGTSKKKKELKLSDLAAASGHPDPFRKAAETYAKAKTGTKSGSGASRTISSTSDYVENVPLGDLTHLNTQEYKYFGFYHRIRQKLEQFWGRSIQQTAEQMVKAGRRIATSDDLITALQITLDEQGEIIAIRVLGPSGVKELDDAAIKSFNQAGPFPNPPRDLVVDGKVVLEWGFVVKT